MFHSNDCHLRIGDVTLRCFIKLFYCDFGSRDSAVGIASSCGLDDRGVTVPVPVGSEMFSTSSRPALGPTQPPIQLVTRSSFPGGSAAGA
jgi:hypothetical protein